MSMSITTDADGNAVVQFGSKKVTFYPLSLRQVQKYVRTIDGLKGATDQLESRFGGVLEVALASAQRGEPATTMDDVEAVVDMGNWKQIMDVVLGNSGAARTPAKPATAVS